MPSDIRAASVAVIFERLDMSGTLMLRNTESAPRGHRPPEPDTMAARTVASEGPEQREQHMAKFWYRVNFRECGKPSMLCGTSEFDLPSLMRELASSPFIRLGDLSYQDTQKAWHPWEDWDPAMEPTVLIQVKEIGTIMPFKGDPRVLATAAR